MQQIQEIPMLQNHDSARMKKYLAEDWNGSTGVTNRGAGEGEKTKAEDCLVVIQKTTGSVFQASRRKAQRCFARLIRNQTVSPNQM